MGSALAAAVPLPVAADATNLKRPRTAPETRGLHDLMTPQTASPPMRGRFLLLPALLLLNLAAPAQATLLSEDESGDVCVDVTSDDPKEIVMIASHCVVSMMLTVQETDDGHVVEFDLEDAHIIIESVRDNGTLVITILVIYAEWGEAFVTVCSDPDKVFPILSRHWDYRCWGWRDWMD